MVVSRSWSYAPRYGSLTLGGAELEEVRSRHIFEATIDCQLTFETHLREVVSKAPWSLGVVRRAEKFFDCRVLKSGFNAYVLSNLEYCASVWMSSAESHLSLLDRVVRSAERSYEGEICCLGHRRKPVPCVFSIGFITVRTTLCVVSGSFCCNSLY